MTEEIKNCFNCGCEYGSHLWNINQNPEGEPDWEELDCKECGCNLYYPSEDLAAF